MSRKPFAEKCMFFLENPLLFYGFFILVGTVFSLWIYFLTPVKGTYYTTYNDYMIFKCSFQHLLQHKNLYVPYVGEYNDLYKYPPTFALLMAPFAYLPNLAGLILWNVLNLLVLFHALKCFPFPDKTKTLLAISFVFIEALTSLFFTQCNCIIAGLMLLTYISLENGKTALAALLGIVAVFIKPFGLAIFILFLFYPGKIRAIGFSLLWFIILLILPLLVISPSGLTDEYRNWAILLKTDHDNSLGWSVFGLMNCWFGINSKISMLLAGLFLLLLPLVRVKLYTNTAFIQYILASILLWVIIFNHKAEPPGYVIAVSGIAVWYFTSRFSIANILLLLSALIFTVLEPTDLFPRHIRDTYVNPYYINVLPSILIWLKITVELLVKHFQTTRSEH